MSRALHTGRSTSAPHASRGDVAKPILIPLCKALCERRTTGMLNEEDGPKAVLFKNLFRNLNTRAGVSGEVQFPHTQRQPDADQSEKSDKRQRATCFWQRRCSLFRWSRSCGSSSRCGRARYEDDQYWCVRRRRRWGWHFASQFFLLFNYGDRGLNDLGCRNIHSFFQSPGVGHLTVDVELLAFGDRKRLIGTVGKGQNEMGRW